MDMVGDCCVSYLMGLMQFEYVVIPWVVFSLCGLGLLELC